VRPFPYDTVYIDEHFLSKLFLLTLEGNVLYIQNMLKVVYPGSFDPPTNGHLNLIKRASVIFDEINVVLAVNVSKSYLFSPEERKKLMEEIVSDIDNVHVHVWDRLIVDFVKKIGAHVLLRGVRAIADFGHEFELSMINRGLEPGIETLFMPTDPEYFVLRSSMIKELVILQGDISHMVPKPVERALKEKLLGA
jgi:pantetheine-phosphate adenylyltransferase